MHFFIHLIFILFLIIPKIIQAQSWLLLPYKLGLEIPDSSFLLIGSVQDDDSVSVKNRLNNFEERFNQINEVPGNSNYIDSFIQDISDQLNDSKNFDTGLTGKYFTKNIESNISSASNQLLAAVNHFSGKDELFQKALNAFSTAKKAQVAFSGIHGGDLRPASKKYLGQLTFSLGMIRPPISGYTFDLYPAVGFVSGYGLGIQLGMVKRISASMEGLFFLAHRIALTWYFNPGIVALLDFEKVRYTFSGNMNSRTHLVSSVKKTVPLYHSVSSFLQISFDLGRLQPGDGYADRFSYQAGIQVQLKTGQRD